MCQTQWSLRLIGDGELRQELEQQAEQLKIADRLEFMGWRDNPWDYADGVSGLVLASDYEAFPLVAIEAMACGRPVFSTPVDGIVELVKPGVNGYLFERNNPEQMAEILDYYARGELPAISPEACREAVVLYEAGAAKEYFEHVIEDCFDKISVIIPCYNVSDKIERCLQSVFAQQLEGVGLEVICVDDHSTDDTLQLLKGWEKQYPEQMTVIAFEENRRQGYARNVALEYATGNYVTYVDADDAMEPECLQMLYNAIIEHQVDVAGCGYQIVSDETRIPVPVAVKNQLFQIADSAEDQRTYLLNCSWKTSPWGRLYRTEFLKNNHIVFAENHFMEDILFSYLCFKYMTTYYHVAQELYLYFYNPDGTMASDRIKTYYLDTAIVQNMAADELLGCDRMSQCAREFEYAYFLKAFEEPMIRMWENIELFSYEDYRYLREEVQKRFPDMEHNSYLQNTRNEETRLAFVLYCADFLTEQDLRTGLNYS